MRAAIMASVSFDTTIWSFMISVRKALTHSFPCFRSSSFWPKRPSWTILSRRLDSTASSVVGCEVVGCCCGSAGMLAFLFGFLAGLFRLGLGGFCFLDGFVQERFELIVAVEAAAQVRQLGAQFEQVVERGYLPRDLVGLEVGEFLKLKFHSH